MKLSTRLLLAIIGLMSMGSTSFNSRHGMPDVASIGKSTLTSKPTNKGDYSGQRYSTLTQINAGNLARLEPRWRYQITSVGAQRGAPVPIIKCTPLLVYGVLYLSIPVHLLALDAATG